MDEVTRKTVLRLLVLAALLAAYPAAILVLRTMKPLPVDAELAGFEAFLDVQPGAPPCTLGVSLRLEHPPEAAFGVASVGLSVLEEGDEQVTRLETGAPLEARTRRDDAGHTLIGPFCLDLPLSDAERLLIVTTRVTEPGSERTRSLLREAWVRGGRAEVIDPEGEPRPDFLKRPAAGEPPPASAP